MTVPDPYLTPGGGSNGDSWSAPHGHTGSIVPVPSEPAPAYPGLPPYVAPAAHTQGAGPTASPQTASPYPVYGAQPTYVAGYAPGYPPGYARGVGYGPADGFGVGGRYGATPPARNGVATAALITGLCSLLLGLVSGGVLGVVGGLVGVGLGIAGLRKAKRGVEGKVRATWGLSLSVLAVAGGTLLFLAMADELGDSWNEGWEEGTGTVGSNDGEGSDDGLAADEYDVGWSDGYDAGYADATSGDAGTRPVPDDAALGEPLALGQTATVGTYQVAVTDIQLDADAIIAAASTDNLPPEGRFILATLQVTNTGPTPTRPVMELLASYPGTDDALYDEWACNAFTPRPVMEVGLLQPGESADYDVCIDLPADAIGDATLVVEDARSMKFSASQWIGS